MQGGNSDTPAHLAGTDPLSIPQTVNVPVAYLQILQALVQATNAQAQNIKTWLAGLAASGDLSGTYPGPMTVAKINGIGLGSTIATAGNLLIGNGTSWVTEPVSGDASITSLGATTVSRIAGQAVAPATWTPTDGSGAALSFSGVSAQVTALGNMVFAAGHLTYPATASGANAVIAGLPFAVPNVNYAQGPCLVWVGAAGPAALQPNKGASTARFVNPTTGALITNATLSGVNLDFMLIYPAS